MDFEELEKLTKEEKINMLNDLVVNDLSYWKKILLAMSLSDEDDSEVLDMIVENKISEIDFICKKYNLQNDVDIVNRQRNLTKILSMILDGNNGDEKYAKACKQVLEILKYIPKEYYEKISSKFITNIKKHADENYNFKIEVGVPFSKIDMFEETEDLLLLISNKFLSDDENVVRISQIYSNNEVK